MMNKIAKLTPRTEIQINNLINYINVSTSTHVGKHLVFKFVCRIVFFWFESIIIITLEYQYKQLHFIIYILRNNIYGYHDKLNGG